MSYRKRHIKNKIYKTRPKKLIFAQFWFWLAALFFIIAFSFFYFLFFYPGFQIKNIIISGNEKVKTQYLYDIVRGNVSSIFLVNKKKIEKDILEKYLVVDKLEINKNFPQTLTLHIIERKALGIYCSNDDCFFIDGEGIIFEPLSTIPDNFTIVRQAIEDRAVFTGEQVISQNIINAISNIKKSLKDNFQIDLTEAMVTSPIRLNVKTSENWQIYFDLDSDSDINSQLTKLNLLLSAEISETTKKNLQYIDLRPKDRAIICDNNACGG